MATSAGGGVVMFGGESVTTPGTLLGDTHTLSPNSQTWTGIGGGPDTPPPTMGHAMAGAVVSGQPAYVVFGGITSTGQSGRTYKYNGNAWGDVTTGVSPLARSGHAMVTNTATSTMLMFGGFDGSVALNDVWEFTPGTDLWAPQTVAAAPIGRFGCCLAFHPGSGGTSGRMYMFGGSPFRNDLWEFNPFTSTWTQLFPVVSPPGRRHAAMAYLVGSDTIVLFGGLSNGGVIRNDTWSYDRWTNTWTQESPTSVPPARYEHAVTPDNTGNALVLLGGTNVLPGAGAGEMIEETWLWSSLLSNWIRQLPSPSVRAGAAMAYDSARDRHVAFGGRTVPGGLDLNETWEIEGVNWRQRSPSTPPPARSDAGMAFDAGRGVTVMYGGRLAGGQELGDTWEWNGTSWTPRFPATTPGPAAGMQLVYDPVRGRTWMLGGSDMWSYDGTTWSRTVLPSPRFGAAHAVDAQRNRLVVFGGTDLVSGYLADTWEWDGGRWSRVTPGTNPPARSRAAMAYHSPTGKCVLQGGYFPPFEHDDSWSWDGGQWVLLGPVAQHGAQAMDYDPVRQVSVMFGGLHQVPGGYNNNTWEWNGSTWSPISITTPPPVRAMHAMAYDPPRNRIVMFGGENSLGQPADTWTYDGTNWTLQAPATSPPARRGCRMAFDATTQRVLLFGGSIGVSPWNSLNDTWLWDGTNWTQAFPSNAPAPRESHVLCSFGGRPVLWGGQDNLTALIVKDMWEWTGTNWVAVDSGSPSARTDYGAAYDARRDRVVVFGGRTVVGGTDLGETWEWDGDSWLQRFPSNPPPPRRRGKLTFDDARARVVLFGGFGGAFTYDDTWEWDGTNWLQRSPTVAPPGSSTHDLTFDQVRKVAVAFGSFGTWDYGPENPASISLYGSGCPTSASVPATAPFGLKPLPWTGAWLGEPVEMEFTNAPPGLGMFLFGLSYTQVGAIPLPVSLALFGLGPAACMLRNSFDVIEVMPVGVTRYVSLPMPNSPNALGLFLYGQAAFFDLGLPGFPIVTSDGVELLVGQK